MDLTNTIEEIGILETNLKIEKYLDNSDLIESISSYIPVTKTLSTEDRINYIVQKILTLKKKNLLLLSNEIALIDKLVEYKECFENIIVVLSRNLSTEQINNIKKNTCQSLSVQFVRELEFPALIKPRDSVILSFGFISGNNCLLLNNSYRMAEIYNGFLGEKVFISCSEENVDDRFKQWISVNANNYFTKVI